MSTQLAGIKFAAVTPQVVKEFLDTATERIVIAKAGYSVAEVEQLVQLLEEREVSCAFYMEKGDNPIRYGLGESEALPIIMNYFDLLNVQSVQQIRMALVIVDDTALVYAPAALAWEELPAELEFPNGFFGDKAIAETLFKQMGGETIVLDIEEKGKIDPEGEKDGRTAPGGERPKIITIKVPPIPKKKPDEVKEEIEETNKKLVQNPPVDPAILRNTTFYRNRFKLLKMTTHGAKIKNKKLDLNPFNDMFPDTNSRLKASWHVLTSVDEQRISSFREFHSAVSKAMRKVTHDAKRYGKLIKTKNISEFENQICQLVTTLTQKLLNIEVSPQQQNIGDNKKITLETLLAESRKSLTDYLFTLALKEEKCWDKLFSNDRSLQRKMNDEKVSKEEAVREAVETFVEYVLKFPTSDNLIELINVDFDYYDVSNELLADDDFMKMLEDFDVEVREYNEGFEKNESSF